MSQLGNVVGFLPYLWHVVGLMAVSGPQWLLCVKGLCAYLCCVRTLLSLLPGPEAAGGAQGVKRARGEGMENVMQAGKPTVHCSHAVLDRVQGRDQTKPLVRHCPDPAQGMVLAVTCSMFFIPSVCLLVATTN